MKNVAIKNAKRKYEEGIRRLPKSRLRNDEFEEFDGSEDDVYHEDDVDKTYDVGYGTAASLFDYMEKYVGETVTNESNLRENTGISQLVYNFLNGNVTADNYELIEFLTNEINKSEEKISQLREFISDNSAMKEKERYNAIVNKMEELTLKTKKEEIEEAEEKTEEQVNSEEVTEQNEENIIYLKERDSKNSEQEESLEEIHEMINPREDMPRKTKKEEEKDSKNSKQEESLEETQDKKDDVKVEVAPKQETSLPVQKEEVKASKKNKKGISKFDRACARAKEFADIIAKYQRNKSRSSEDKEKICKISDVRIFETFTPDEVYNSTTDKVLDKSYNRFLELEKQITDICEQIEFKKVDLANKNPREIDPEEFKKYLPNVYYNEEKAIEELLGKQIRNLEKELAKLNEKFIQFVENGVDIKARESYVEIWESLLKEQDTKDAEALLKSDNIILGEMSEEEEKEEKDQFYAKEYEKLLDKQEFIESIRNYSSILTTDEINQIFESGMYKNPESVKAIVQYKQIMNGREYKIPYWIEEGQKIIFPERYYKWEKCVRERANNEHNGDILDCALDIMRALESGKSIDEIAKILSKNFKGYSDIKDIVFNFSSKGPEFYEETTDLEKMTSKEREILKSKIEAKKRQNRLLAEKKVQREEYNETDKLNSFKLDALFGSMQNSVNVIKK